MQNMYMTIRPQTVKFKKNQLQTKYVSFDDFILNCVNSFGFTYLFSRIIDEYSNRMSTRIPYNEFWGWRSKLIEDFKGYNRKWEYFSKNNILLTDENIRVGKTLRYKNYGDAREIKLTELEISEGRLHGEINGVNGKNFLYTIRFCDLVDKDDNPLKIDFAVKRKGKIYYGKNK